MAGLDAVQKAPTPGLSSAYESSDEEEEAEEEEEEVDDEAATARMEVELDRLWVEYKERHKKRGVMFQGGAGGGGANNNHPGFERKRPRTSKFDCEKDTIVLSTSHYSKGQIRS